MKSFILAGLLALAGPIFSERNADGVTEAVNSMLAGRSLDDLGSETARSSIRGTKALWVELNFQKAAQSPAMDNLKADLKLTDMEGQLRSAGFRIMDPQKKSLALGKRPTLALSVVFVAKGGALKTDFYLLLAEAVQDVVPLGGSKLSMTTWLRASDPIASSGDVQKDVGAIRAAARAAVLAFIETAKSEEKAKP